MIMNSTLRLVDALAGLRCVIVRTVGCALAVLAAVAVSSSVSIANDRGPNELIESVAQQILAELEANRALFKEHPEKIYALVDEHMLPHFDTQFAARIVLAKHWREATSEQRERFINAFYQSMLQNYGEALLDFTAERLTILPFRGDLSTGKATVKSEVTTDDGTRVPVSYSMRATPQGWKAWDVTVEGISYVKNFRVDIGAEVDQRGLDAVIARLESEAKD
jgi:phospholipid transport system substrate-binding protein